MSVCTSQTHFIHNNDNCNKKVTKLILLHNKKLLSNEILHIVCVCVCVCVCVDKCIDLS